MSRRLFPVIAVSAIVTFWAWPTSGWVNERADNGDCLAWRVTRWADGLVTQIDHGPHIVNSRWC